MSQAPSPKFSPRKLLKPFEQFFKGVEQFIGVEAASGVVLLLVTAVALVWANSPWAASYDGLWHAKLTLGFGPLARNESLHFWINDGLMTVFFLVVGLEIRRELHEGTLSQVRAAALPLAGAVGGVLLPALIYVAFNQDSALLRGWAVPTATDIAFAVGVLAVLGKRVPSSLRVVLLALAIIDDIVAIMIIALFYSAGGIELGGFAIAAGGIVLTLVMQRLRVRRALPYVIPGAVVWWGLLQAGVHPALAGVVLGMLTPVHPIGDETRPPVAWVESALHPWVAFGIMPLFALANAGVSFGGISMDAPATAPLLAGIFFGLVVGKPVGIVVVSMAACRLGLCTLPDGVDVRGLLVMGLLGGIGFTMSIFIAYLAFPDPELLSMAKFAVLAGSCTAGALGLFAGWRFLRPPQESSGESSGK